MREKNIHIWDGFPCFVTESHTHTELDTIIATFKESAQKLISAGFFIPKQDNSAIFEKKNTENDPPVAGARLGRDREGNPAWFIADPEQPGKYLQVQHKE